VVGYISVLKEMKMTILGTAVLLDFNYKNKKNP